MTTDTMAAPAENKDLMLVNGSMELIRDVPEILSGNQAGAAKARLATKELIDRIGLNGNQLNEELDNEAQALIVRLKESAKKMEDRRKPFTQIVQSITKMFTGIEREVIELADAIQPFRNDWAKHLQQEAERKQKEAERKAAIENAKADLKASITEAIGIVLSNYLYIKKNNWLNSFNAITLETFEEKAAKMKSLSTDFNKTKLNEILEYDVKVPLILSANHYHTARIDAHQAYDFGAWIANYNLELAELKQSLIDKLPSKKAELEAAAAAERERLAAIEAAAKAEAERQAAMAKANAAQKEKLEKEAAIARAAEEKKMAELTAEQDRQAAERATREADDAARLTAEKSEQERKAREAAEMAAASSKAQTLFDAAIEATPDNVAPESRTGFEIKVLHHAGLAEIFQHWYTNEGVKLTIEDARKKSINQMIAWAEGHAKKTGEKISSKYISYEASVKAINRKG